MEKFGHEAFLKMKNYKDDRQKRQCKLVSEKKFEEAESR